MSFAKRRKGASKAPFFLIFLLVVFLPLIFIPGLISLYRLPKNALFAVLTSLLCWSWLFSHVRKEKHRQAEFPLFIPVLGYLTSTGLSLFKAVNLYEGLIAFSLIALGIALFWITFNGSRHSSVPAIFRTIVFIAGLVSLLGILQVWAVDVPGLIPTGGPGSTFGNRNMAAQFLLFSLSPAFYLLLTEGNPAREKNYALFTGLISTYFVYTGTRAAWGAAAFSFVALWVSLRIGRAHPQGLISFDKKKLNLLFAVSIFVLAMNTLPRYFVPNFGAPSVLSRLHSMLEFEENTSARGRFSIWANTMAMFWDHPALGVGKGNFRFVYPLYASSMVIDPTFGPTTKAADTHNDYLQILGETGTLGALSFLLVISLLGRRIWLGLRETANPALAAIAFSLLAILAQAFWDFPLNLPVPIALFWIHAGLAWRLTESTPDALAEKKFLPLTVALLFTIYSTGFSALMVSALHGHFYYSRGAWATAENDFHGAERNLDLAIKKNPLDYRHHFLYGLLMIKRGEFGNAIGPIRQSLSLNPYDINAWNNLGVAFASLGDTSRAIQALEASVRIWPYYIDAHNNLGTIYAHQGNHEKALQHFRTVLRLDPSNSKASTALKALAEPPS